MTRAKQPEPRSHRPRLVARSLTVRAYGADRVRQIDFELFRGDALGVVGPSGAGKSTFARALVGLHELTGSLALHVDPDPRVDPESCVPIELAGASAAAWTRARRHIRLAWQDPTSALDPRTSVEQAAALSRRLAGHPPFCARALADALDEVELDPSAAGRTPRQLSGGQCQRAGMLVALAAQPHVLVLDEPTVALDRPRAWALHSLLAARKRAGMTLVLVTHDLAWLPGLADRLLIVDRGAVVDHGPTTTLLDSPRHPLTRRLVEAMPRKKASERPPAPSGTQLE